MSKSGQKLQVVAKTDVGKVREHNEDNFIVTDFNSDQWLVPRGAYHNSDKGTVMVIADGMGGLNAGEVASRIAVDSIMEYYNQLRELEIGANPPEELEDAILSAHEQILSYGKVNPETEGMGTTVVLAHIHNCKIHISWSGDSRGYLFRDGRLSQLTRDHSYVQTLLDDGKITKEQAFYHPNGNIITQSLGDQARPPEPGFVSENLHREDIILLCSDGLNAMLPDEVIEEHLMGNANDLPVCLDKLIFAANEAGGNDNITVILVKVMDGEKSKLIPGKKDELLPRPKNNLLLYLVLFLLLIVGVLLWRLFTPEKPEPVSPDTSKKELSTDSLQVKRDVAPVEQHPDEKPGNTKNEKKPHKKEPEKEPEKDVPVKIKNQLQGQRDSSRLNLLQAQEGLTKINKKPDSGAVKKDKIPEEGLHKIKDPNKKN